MMSICWKRQGEANSLVYQERCSRRPKGSGTGKIRDYKEQICQPNKYSHGFVVMVWYSVFFEQTASGLLIGIFTMPEGQGLLVSPERERSCFVRATGYVSYLDASKSALVVAVVLHRTVNTSAIGAISSAKCGGTKIRVLFLFELLIYSLFVYQLLFVI